MTNSIRVTAIALACAPVVFFGGTLGTPAFGQTTSEPLSKTYRVTRANDGFPNYTYFETDVHLAPLRATPRFRAFLAKLRMEWEHIPGEPD